MQLSMTVLRCPDQVAPEARTVSGGEFHVGRGPDVDWVLPDPDRLLSKRHFAVAFRGGSWQVADTSTNGTYLNTDVDAIGRGAPRSLRDGDRLRLGAYEIEVRLVDQPAQSSYQGGAFPGASYPGGSFGGGSGQSPFGDPFGEDVMAPPPPARRPFDEPAYPDLGLAQTSARLPHDFDPLAPDRDDGFGGFQGPVQADHSSSMEDAMIPPPIAGYAAPAGGGIIPGDDLLPDDWDKDLLEGIGSPAPVATPAPPVPHAAPPFAAPPHIAPNAAPPVAPAGARTPPADPLDFLDDPLGDGPGAASGAASGGPAVRPAFSDAVAPAPAVRAPEPPAYSGAAPVVRQRAPLPAATGSALAPPEPEPFVEPETAAATAIQAAPEIAGFAPDPARIEAAEPSPAASPFDEPSDHPPPAARPVAAPTAGPMAAQLAGPPRGNAGAAGDSGLLAAFFAGAGLAGANPPDPAAMMTGLGRAFRAAVSGLREVLIARASIKDEFRIEQTMIRKKGNNPLRFSIDDDDALTALFGIGRRTEMAPAAAIEDSLRDIRLHEVAVMAAMQVAVRAMLDELGPDKIRAAADQGGMTVLPAQRKARAWEAFESRHAAVVQALADDFDSVFGKSFARAYERALDEISMRERQ